MHRKTWDMNCVLQKDALLLHNFIFLQTVHQYHYYITVGIRHRTQSCFLYLSTLSLRLHIKIRIIIKWDTPEITAEKLWLVLQQIKQKSQGT